MSFCVWLTLLSMIISRPFMLLQMTVFHSISWLRSVCLGLLRWHNGERFACWCKRQKRHEFDPWVEKIPGVRNGSILAWTSPWREEPGGLQSMDSQRVRLDWAHTQYLFIHLFTTTPLSIHLLVDIKAARMSWIL